MTGYFSEYELKDLLDQYLPHRPQDHWYRGNEIPEKKLQNAIYKYADDVFLPNVLALGDGTVFGSAKIGILLTTDRLYSNTPNVLERTFCLPLHEISKASNGGGWPNYYVDIESLDGRPYQISMTCFDKSQPGLIDFLNALGELNRGESLENGW